MVISEIYFPRMAVWKHYIILFGGFYDPGITSQLFTFEADELRSKML
jgi:hypothetical protein